MLSNALFILFIVLLVVIVAWAFLEELKNAPTKCNYNENKDCENLDKFGMCDCENCEFYKLLNEGN